MEDLIHVIGYYSAVLVPLLAVWAILGLYTLGADRRCHCTECAFFLAMLIVAGCTIRTVVANDACWLVHTASLGCLVVAGVMRRPVDTDQYVAALGGNPVAPGSMSSGLGLLEAATIEMDERFCESR